MKKKLAGIVLAMVMFLMVGCAAIQEHVQIDQDSQEIIAKITGRRAGYELAKEYPVIADQVKTVCMEIIATEDTDLIVVATKQLAIALTAEIDDPLLAADITDILTLIKIESGVEITENQIAVIRAAAEGLVSGIGIYK